MKLSQFQAAAALAAVIAIGMGILTRSSTVQANDDYKDIRVQQGFAIAPVPLNLAGKDRDLVGLGSYFVNTGGCNDCHTQSPATEFSSNPYLLPPVFTGKKVVNAATYLGGGQDFGPLVPGSIDIISRNLTPDKTGRPEGGHTLSQFIQIMRTGVDMDHLHPTCPGSTVATNCVPFPFNGALLQIMPWPGYQSLTDHDLQAIYEYLSAVPCIEGPTDPKNPLHNDCH